MPDRRRSRRENLLAVAALLDNLDVDLLQARSGAEALELLLVHEVALALLDVQMPQMDGFELAELMRGSERTRHVPIIFLTAGFSDTRRQFKGYELGAVDFLHKPIEPSRTAQQGRACSSSSIARSVSSRMNSNSARARCSSTRCSSPCSVTICAITLSAMIFAGSILQRSADASTPNSADPHRADAAGALNRMIADLLDLARARLAGGIAINVEEADLGIIATHQVRARSHDAAPANFAAHAERQPRPSAGR